MLKFSKHTREMMAARGITKEEVEEAVNRGSNSFQNPDKIIASYRHYRVVYKKIKDDCFVITVKPR